MCRDCPEFCAEYWDQHEPRPPNAPGYVQDTSISESVTVEDNLTDASPPPQRSETFELDDTEGEVDSLYLRYKDDASTNKDSIRPSLSPSSFQSSSIDNTISDQTIPSTPRLSGMSFDKVSQRHLDEMMDKASAPKSPLPTHLSAISDKQPILHNHTMLKDKMSSLHRSPLGEKAPSPQPSQPISSFKGKTRLQSSHKVTFQIHDQYAKPTLDEKPSHDISPKPSKDEQHDYSHLLDGITSIPAMFKRRGFTFAKDTDYPTHDTQWNQEIDKLYYIQHIESKNQLLAYVIW